MYKIKKMSKADIIMDSKRKNNKKGNKRKDETK